VAYWTRLGHMGRAFAVNLVEDGHQVSVYDRNPERTAALTGARDVGQLADLATCDVVVTSLPDDDALAAVALGPGGLVDILAAGDGPHFHEHGQLGDLQPRRQRARTPSSGLYRRTGAREPGLRARAQAIRARRRPAIGARQGASIARAPWSAALRYRPRRGDGEPLQARGQCPHRDNARMHGRGAGAIAKGWGRSSPRLRCPDKFVVRFPGSQHLRREELSSSTTARRVWLRRSPSRTCGWRWPKPNTRRCRCPRQAWSTSASSEWSPAAGPSWTGRRSVCSRRSMPGSARIAETAQAHGWRGCSGARTAKPLGKDAPPALGHPTGGRPAAGFDP
jgi:6-phosphogluconate dehydrogenase-like protein